MTQMEYDQRVVRDFLERNNAPDWIVEAYERLISVCPYRVGDKVIVFDDLYEVEAIQGLTLHLLEIGRLGSLVNPNRIEQPFWCVEPFEDD